MYDDDVPFEDLRRTSEAEASAEPTGIPLSGPSNASPSSSLSGPQVEGETIEDISCVNDQTPGPEQASEDIREVPTQEQQPSAQSTNVPDLIEGNSNDQPYRVKQ